MKCSPIRSEYSKASSVKGDVLEILRARYAILEDRTSVHESADAVNTALTVEKEMMSLAAAAVSEPTETQLKRTMLITHRTPKTTIYQWSSPNQTFLTKCGCW